MALFNRKLQITVGNDDEAVIIKQPLKITAKIVKDGKVGEDDFAEISIYNLSEETRGRFNEQYSKIIIEAGYDTELSVAFVGDIQNATHSKEGTEWITRVIAGDGAQVLDQALINKTYKKGTTLGDMLDDIQRISGVDELTAINIDLDKILERGKSVNDMARNVLTKEGQSNGFDWSMQDGKFVLVDIKKSRVETFVVLSATSGLIGTPEWINSGNDKSQTVTQEGTRIKTVSLAMPTIRPFDKILIKSGALSGKIGAKIVNTNSTEMSEFFKVIKVMHEFNSYDGDFKTTIESQLTEEQYIEPEPFNEINLQQGGTL